MADTRCHGIFVALVEISMIIKYFCVKAKNGEVNSGAKLESQKCPILNHLEGNIFYLLHNSNCFIVYKA